MALSADIPTRPEETSPPPTFEAYVHTRSPALLRMAFLLTGDTHLAEDLVQTALAKVVDRWTALVAQGDPHPYVRTVVLHTALGWRRRRWQGERPSASVPDRGRPGGRGGRRDRPRAPASARCWRSRPASGPR